MDTYRSPSLFFYFILTLFFLTSHKFCYAQQINDSLRHYYDAILQPKNSSDLYNGVNYYLKQKEQNLLDYDTIGAISDLRMIAIGRFKIGFKYESENTIVEALKLIDNNHRKDTLIDSKIGLYNQLGKIYREFGNNEKAIENYNLALNLAVKRNDSVTIINNIANVHKDLEEYEVAETQYSHIYNMIKGGKDNLAYARVLDNLGYVRSKLNEPDALKYIEESLTIRRKENDFVGMYTSYRNLSYYYSDREAKEEGLQYAEKAYEVANRINSGAYRQNALALFMELDDNPKVVEYRRLTDSLSKAKQLAENKNAFIKYNLEEEQKKTAASKLQQEKEKRLKLLYQGIAALILIALITSYFVFRYRYKRGKIEEAHKTETRISKKIHDEVANGVYHIMTRLQDVRNADEEVLDELEDIYIKTRDISKENSTLNVGGNFKDLLNDLLASYEGENIKVITRNLSKIDWTSLSDLKKIAIFRVLQELMTNMKKHSKATIAVLTFEKIKKKIRISYTDNGIGCDLVKGNGLKNVENRITPLNGSITFDSELQKGFKAKITI